MKPVEYQDEQVPIADEVPLPLREDKLERARRLLENPDWPGIDIARSVVDTIMPVLR